MTNALVPVIPYLCLLLGIIFLLHATLKVLGRKQDHDPVNDTAMKIFQKNANIGFLFVVGLCCTALGAAGIYHQFFPITQ